MVLKSRYMLKAVSCALLVLGVAVPASAEFRFTPYGAIGGNISNLSPDAADSGFEVSETNGVGASLLLGADVFDRWSVEAGFNDLGEATLESPVTGEETIGYTAVSLSALFHLFGDSTDIAERRGGWTYLRLGVNQVDNESDLELEESDSTSIWAGIGYEYSFSSLLSVRGELATFDGDAQAITAALVLRPFSPPTRSRNRQVSRAPQTPTRPANPSVPAPAPVPSDNPRRLPIPNTPAAPSPFPNTLANRIASCETPVGIEPVDQNGCALISGVRSEIQFASESPVLLPDSLSAVATLASAINRAPGLRVEIQVHTESVQGPAASQELSRQRVVAVARALVAAGVDVRRLGARAFGNQEPIISTGSLAGQVMPNRVEFIVAR